MEMKAMKKKGSLLTLLTLLLAVHPSYGMQPVHALPATSNVFNRLQKYVKPLIITIGTAAFATAGYILWKYYTEEVKTNSIKKKNPPTFTPNNHAALVYNHYLTLKALIYDLELLGNIDESKLSKEKLAQWKKNLPAKRLEKIKEIRSFKKSVSPELFEEIITYKPQHLAQIKEITSLKEKYATTELIANLLAKSSNSSTEKSTSEYSNEELQEHVRKHLTPLLSYLDHDSKVIEAFHRLKSFIADAMTPSDALEKYIDNLAQENILEDVLKYNNNPHAQCVIEMETLYYCAYKQKSCSPNQGANQNYIIKVYYNTFQSDVAKIHQEIFSKK